MRRIKIWPTIYHIFTFKIVKFQSSITTSHHKLISAIWNEINIQCHIRWIIVIKITSPFYLTKIKNKREKELNWTFLSFFVSFFFFCIRASFVDTPFYDGTIFGSGNNVFCTLEFNVSQIINFFSMSLSFWNNFSFSKIEKFKVRR